MIERVLEAYEKQVVGKKTKSNNWLENTTKILKSNKMKRQKRVVILKYLLAHTSYLW